MAQSLYQEWFVKFRFSDHQNPKFTDSSHGKIPDNWDIKTLEKLVVFKRDSVKKGELLEKTPYMGLEHFPRKSISLSNWDVLKEYKIAIPSDEALNIFNKVANPILEQIRILSLKNENLKKQRDMLLPKLISGQIEL